VGALAVLAELVSRIFRGLPRGLTAVPELLVFGAEEEEDEDEDEEELEDAEAVDAVDVDAVDVPVKVETKSIVWCGGLMQKGVLSHLNRSAHAFSVDDSEPIIKGALEKCGVKEDGEGEGGTVNGPKTLNGAEEEGEVNGDGERDEYDGIL
jgi:hypothetical protein